ncbi:unnamed protein product [Moneuplotes crassus]|uniref:RING-type domain-containing protein n=1 Tax=Euplotes crassus TaxID=5936 RepID=A0AAD1U9Y9_EUPCR|nr:unnamed protein product [Moneuplotes crassus]
MDSFKKDGPVDCSVCLSEIKRTHGGITCAQDHHTCPDCCVELIDDLLCDPQTKIPAKCKICTVELNSAQIEMHLAPGQDKIYQKHLIKKSIDPTEEVLVSCPFCKYAEVWGVENDCNYFYCRAEACKKASCAICHREFKAPKSFAVSEEEYEEMYSEGGMLTHQRCLEYKDMKADWDKATQLGVMRVCPGCGKGGRKDYGCTHMTCGHCSTNWCYFCGKKEADLDKSNPYGSIGMHNTDWETNPNRCPFNLIEIGEIDERWDKDNDDINMEILHKILCNRAIKDFFEKYSISEFEELCEVFPTVANHGQDLEEAKTMDLTLIKR